METVLPRLDEVTREALAEALDRIGRGAAQHLVLARVLDAELPAPADPDRLWAELVARVPGGHAFLVRPRDGGPVLECGPRADGRGPADRLRRPSLHRLRRAPPHGLGRRGRPAVPSCTPRPRADGTSTSSSTWPAAWHLATRLTGRLHRGTSALHAAVALHRAAGGGTPSREALSLIRELEPRPRGAFAGLVGWTDAA